MKNELSSATSNQNAIAKFLWKSPFNVEYLSKQPTVDSVFFQRSYIKMFITYYEMPWPLACLRRTSMTNTMLFVFSFDVPYRTASEYLYILLNEQKFFEM